MEIKIRTNEEIINERLINQNNRAKIIKTARQAIKRLEADPAYNVLAALKIERVL